ncbi:MAG: TIR domain-containing protein [Candidatus Acidiferrum sp.]|jgi:hypothetical protein
MNFESDAFISYAHLDNVELVEGHKGWVSNLHRALEVRVAQLLGKQPQIWRDPKLQGNDHFAETLVEKLRRVAILVSVVSPRYVKSDWARKELSAFWQAAETQGGIRFHDKMRIFKVLKTPVPFDNHPAELQPLLGYEFFKVDPETGRIRELDEIFGPEAQRDFWLKLDDLAHDICYLLEMLEHPDAAPASQPTGPGVFLAETTSDVREQRETLRRDLQQHGYVVFPMRPLPSVASEVKAAVSDDLARCQLSVLLVGKNHSSVPEGGMDSLLEIQNELAIERNKKGSFSRLLWIPPALKVEDERQIKFIERLRMDPRILDGADLLETFLEDLRTVIHAKLKRSVVPVPPAAPAPAAQASVALPASNAETGTHPSLYVIHDQRDSEPAYAYVEHLFDHFEVLQPVFAGDEAEIREYHDENLRHCDGVLIFYGSTNECWLRRKLREVQKAPGYGRTKPAPTIGIVMAPPRTPEKERFRTHDAMVLPQFDGLSAPALQQFITSLKR